LVGAVAAQRVGLGVLVLVVLLAGMCARRRTYFSLPAKEK
jgi:hypothetical protein